jgi:hypothetical protein
MHPDPTEVAMDSFIDFVSRLIYATGGEAVLTPNHRDWLSTHPVPTGSEWLDHHVDRLLPAYEGWLASHTLPPVVPWNGVRPEPWDPSSDVPLGTDLDGSFTGIGSLEDLGAALRDRLQLVDNAADELSGAEKAPFSYRYWGYLKWASAMRDRYNGAVILPPTYMYDRDGTPLSAIPFADVFNELHWRWHNADGATPTATAETPGLVTSAGQRASAGGVGMPGGEEFVRFHRDHVELFTRWLARTGQPAVRGIDVYNGGAGWPGATNPGNPSTWVEADDDPWINDEAGDTDGNLRTQITDANDLGNSMSIHGAGHLLNSDIASIFHNNYVPRFHAWHGWIDNQLWWREPRFARWNAVTGLRDRVFAPVLSTDADWPGLPALTIVRDPLGAGDTVAPANGVAGLDLTTGAGTLRMRLLVQDSYDRPVRLRLRADVYDDAVSSTVPVETIPEATHTYIVGDAGTGDDFDLNTEFPVDLVFAGAFLSDDPSAASPAVGFVNSRIRVTGTLEVADGSDPGYSHRDFCDIRLVQEKDAPRIDLYFDLSTFGDDQVDSAMAMGEARFANALIVVIQDRTSQPAPTAWPAAVADEVKGLITGFVPAAGLFDDAAHAPEVEILDGGAPIKGVSVELSSGPDPEDPALPDSLPQRFTYRYDVVFRPNNKAFTGLAPGGSRLADVRVSAADRAGNAATETGVITFLMGANPFMRDGDTSWLSIDTRVFRLFEGEGLFNATLSPGSPTAFIQQVIQNLNAGTTGGDTFGGLPTDQPGSALEYSTAIDNPSTGTSQNVHNFALAKVRLQGAGGAADVRAYFRLFRYTSTNLVFDPSTGYRTAPTLSPVPLLGYSSAGPGGQVISIPFFAEPRVGHAQPMTTQSDAPNVQSFPAGPSDERVLYFGAYLDINQSGARLPASYIPAHPDGGFAAGEVQSIRSLMTDAHQCMVVEIDYIGDPTATGATPASSDNLAQRNLMILYTDNPGAALTHTVQHSFEVHTGRRLPDGLPHREVLGLTEFLLRNDKGPSGPPANGGEDDPGEPPAPPVRGHDRDGYRDDVALAGPPPLPPRLISSEQRARRVRREAVNIAMLRARTMMEMMDPAPHMEEAAAFVDQRFPFVFDAARWGDTTDHVDELLFDWNGLPAESHVEVYLPGVRCEDVMNLRTLRHAPGDVRIVDAHTLRLDPVGVTFLPVPSPPDGRLPGVVTITLPDGIRKGQRWQVDVVQLRGGERRTLGGFQMDIQVSEARAIADAERRLLVHMVERLSLTPRTDRWRPVLQRRVETIRARARALAESAGTEWEDPTVWFDPDDPTTPRPVEGASLRVVLERVQILEDRDPWFKGKGEIRFAARVYTANNGGTLRQTRLPETGVFKISDRPGRNMLELNRVLFEGYAADDLRIEIVGTEEDTFDPDDTVGKYTRLFTGSPDRWFGEYGPNGGPVDPEDMVAWKVWYRIERT